MNSAEVSFAFDFDFILPLLYFIFVYFYVFFLFFSVFIFWPLWSSKYIINRCRFWPLKDKVRPSKDGKYAFGCQEISKYSYAYENESHWSRCFETLYVLVS